MPLKLPNECDGFVNAWLVAAGHYAGRRVQLDDVRVRKDRRIAEVEHVGEWTGDGICRSSPETLAAKEDILDEANDRGLVSDGSVEEVLFSPGRDDQEGLTGTVAATALSVGSRRGIDARQSGGSGSRADADSGSVDEVRSGGRAVDRIVDVIVPAVGVVIGDDDLGAGPER